MANDNYRDYVIKKCVRARTAAEAIEISAEQPVIEVYEMKDAPDVSNAETAPLNAVGFRIER